MDRKEYQRQYRLKNKEKLIEASRIRGKLFRDSPKGKKLSKIKGWRHRGLIDDYERVHAIWEETTACNLG